MMLHLLGEAAPVDQNGVVQLYVEEPSLSQLSTTFEDGAAGQSSSNNRDALVYPGALTAEVLGLVYSDAERYDSSSGVEVGSAQSVTGLRIVQHIMLPHVQDLNRLGRDGFICSDDSSSIAGPSEQAEHANDFIHRSARRARCPQYLFKRCVRTLACIACYIMARLLLARVRRRSTLIRV